VRRARAQSSSQSASSPPQVPLRLYRALRERMAGVVRCRPVSSTGALDSSGASRFLGNLCATTKESALTIYPSWTRLSPAAGWEASGRKRIQKGEGGDLKEAIRDGMLDGRRFWAAVLGGGSGRRRRRRGGAFVRSFVRTLRRSTATAAEGTECSRRTRQGSSGFCLRVQGDVKSVDAKGSSSFRPKRSAHQSSFPSAIQHHAAGTSPEPYSDPSANSL
jgi:hypothetical protein